METLARIALGNLKLSGITVAGYKSILTRTSLRLNDLTVLAGANNSGKSAILEPLLLYKQTLDSSTDLGPLKLDGPSVIFSSARHDMFSRLAPDKREARFNVGFTTADGSTYDFIFRPSNRAPVELIAAKYNLSGVGPFELRPSMTHGQLHRIVSKLKLPKTPPNMNLTVERSRCFLELVGTRPVEQTTNVNLKLQLFPISNLLGSCIQNVLYVPSMRDMRVDSSIGLNPKGPYPGEFDEYVPSLISHWQRTKNSKLVQVESAMAALGLTRGVRAKRISDIETALYVQRAERADDFVSVDETGFGLQQVLPVLAAIAALGDDGILYVEEPESNLHPLAQYKLAQIIADAVAAGKRIILETHSAIMIRGFQESILKGALQGKGVTLHWFQRNAEGATHIASHDLDETGALGDWPGDFATVDMMVEENLLEAMANKAKARS
jgi:predicted ATPase